MRSTFAVFLRGFTLPFGATSGRRLVFDGVNGAIELYDVNGDLRIRLGGTTDPEAIAWYTAHASETAGGGIETLVTGPGANEVPNLQIKSPTFAPDDDWAEVTLRGSSEGSDPATIRLGNGQGTQPQRLALDAGTNKFLHTGVVLVAGSSGAVANPVVTAASILFLTRTTPGGTLGHLSYTVGAGTFTVNSDNPADTSTVAALIMETF